MRPAVSSGGWRTASARATPGPRGGYLYELTEFGNSKPLRCTRKGGFIGPVSTCPVGASHACLFSCQARKRASLADRKRSGSLADLLCAPALSPILLCLCLLGEFGCECL